jgi:hypothetical protein
MQTNVPQSLQLTCAGLITKRKLLVAWAIWEQLSQDNSRAAAAVADRVPCILALILATLALHFSAILHESTIVLL